MMSKADSELVNDVNYQLENESNRALPTLKGWSSCETTGALGVIHKDHGSEKITVRFMVNGIMPTLAEQDRLEEEGQEVLCYPQFEVNIEKANKKAYLSFVRWKDQMEKGQMKKMTPLR